MKKLFFLCIAIVIAIPIITYAQSNVSGISLQEISHTSNFHISIENEIAFSYIQKLVYVPEEPFDMKSVAEIIERISNIHPKHLKALTDKGVKLKLFTGKLTDEPEFRHLRGNTPKGWSSWKTWEDVPGAGGTYVVAAKIGHSEPGNGHGSINLELHELAHSLDKIVYKISESDQQFLEIWEEEVEEIFPKREYFINYPEEYFAETFAMFYLSETTKQELQEKAPKTYEYFQNLEHRKKVPNIIPHI